jgi:hypothetical protein
VDKLPIEMIAKLLRRAEAKVNKHGWDQVPTLFGALVSDEDGSIRIVSFGKVPGSPREYLPWVAAQFAANPDLALKFLARFGGGLFGLAYGGEAWSVKGEAAMAEAREAKSRGLGLGDLMSAKETRLINAIDVLGRTVYLKRIRGEKPIIRHSEMPEKPVIGGVVPHYLREIMLTFVPHMEGADEFTAALEAADIPMEIAPGDADITDAHAGG